MNATKTSTDRFVYIVLGPRTNDRDAEASLDVVGSAVVIGRAWTRDLPSGKTVHEPGPRFTKTFATPAAAQAAADDLDDLIYYECDLVARGWARLPPAR